MNSFYLFGFYLLLIGSSVADQSDVQTTPSSDAARTPLSRFLSDLEGFVLDVDETIHKVISPKTSETTIQGEDGKLRGTRTNYFEQVRENYDELQKKIQKSLENPAELFKLPELMNINFQNQGQKSSLDISSPILPMNMQFKTKRAMPEPAEKSEKKTETSMLPNLELPDVSGSIKIGGDTAKSSTKKSNELNDKMSAKPEMQKRSGMLNTNSKSFNSKPEVEKNFQQTSSKNSIYARSNVEDISSGKEDSIRGRMLGELLFEESSFDKYLRRALRNHGNWLLNTNIPAETLIENIRAATRNNFENRIGLSSNREHISSGGRLSSMNHGTDGYGSYPSSTQGYNSRIILAFTTEGVPLKIRSSLRTSDALDFLDEVLTASGVSLNIPIDSYRGSQPVGNDLLQLGSSYGGVEVMHLNLDDDRQLDALLRSLKRFRN